MKPILVVLLVMLAWLNADAFERTALGDSIDKATLKMLKEVYQEVEDKNVIISPLGVFLLLSIYSAGAGPAGRQEIDDFLGGGDHKQLSESYSSLSNDFSSMDPSYLTLANKVYVSDMYEVEDAFADVVRAFNSETSNINFLDSEKAADTINAWAAEKTQGHIKTPVSPSDITSDTLLALLNVIFFEGEWAVPFDKSKTQDEDFYMDKDTVIKKPSMSLVDTLPYGRSEDLGASLIELRFKEDGFRMIIVLPDETDGLPAVLEKAEQKGLLEDMFKLDKIKMRLTIPKFEMKTKLDFKDILPMIGVSRIFEEDTTGVVKNDFIKVHKIIQEAYVKVDEKGAIATAVTAMLVIGRMFTPSPLEVKVDHPFIFCIMHNDKVLFAGTHTH